MAQPLDLAVMRPLLACDPGKEKRLAATNSNGKRELSFGGAELDTLHAPGCLDSQSGSNSGFAICTDTTYPIAVAAIGGTDSKRLKGPLARLTPTLDLPNWPRQSKEHFIAVAQDPPLTADDASTFHPACMPRAIIV